MAGLGQNYRILVTGASGFLGGHLVRVLLSAGADVIAVGRDAEKLGQLNCPSLQHDIALPFETAALPDIDAIVHCAALSSPFGKRRDFMRANVRGTENVAALAREKNIARIVHISTPSVYFTYQDQLDVTEDMPLPPPVNAYAETKAMAERIVRTTLGQNAIILRPRGIYGPGDMALLPRLLRAARQRPLPVLRGGVAAIDLTYVGDVVDAVMASLAAGQDACGHTFNISSGELLRVQHIVDRVCQRAQIEPRWRTVPLGLAIAAAGAMEGVAHLRRGAPEPAVTRYGLGLFAYRQSLNITKARSLLNWMPKTDFAAGLDKTFETGL